MKSPYEVEQGDLAALVGLPRRDLKDIVACLVPARRRGSEVWYRWRDIEPFLDRTELARARKRLRELRMKPHGSKYWVAGYPHLVAQWHPTKNGELMPDEIRYGSRRKIWWMCPKGVGHEWQSTPNSRTGRGDGCPFCSRHRVTRPRCLAVRAPQTAAQWHSRRNGALTPFDISVSSNRPVWWICREGHEWRTSPSRRRQRSGCPFCSGHRVSPTNNLAARTPSVASQWHPLRNEQLTASDVTAGSNRSVWWKCPIGGDHEWQARVHERVARGLGCPYCSGQRPSRAHSLAVRHPAIARQWHPTRNGEQTPRDVTPRSHRSFWWKCPRGPDHEWRAPVLQRTGPGQGGGCPFCLGRRVSVTNSLATRIPDLAAQWHPTRNGRLTPESVVAGSAVRVWWRCPKDRSHAWSTRLVQRTSQRNGCPYCTGRRVSRSNTLAAMFPAVAREWHPRRNGALTPKDVYAGSARHVWWLCSRDPGHVWRARVHQRTRLNTGCPVCARRRPWVRRPRASAPAA